MDEICNLCGSKWTPDGKHVDDFNVCYNCVQMLIRIAREQQKIDAAQDMIDAFRGRWNK